MARQFSQDQVASTLPNWDAIVNANSQRILQWLNGHPFPLKRFYRESASNASSPACLNLVTFPAAQEEGGMAYLKDPEPGEQNQIWSDGTDWRYLITGNVVTGIS